MQRCLWTWLKFLIILPANAAPWQLAFLWTLQVEHVVEDLFQSCWSHWPLGKWWQLLHPWRHPLWLAGEAGSYTSVHCSQKIHGWLRRISWHEKKKNDWSHFPTVTLWMTDCIGQSHFQESGTNNTFTNIKIFLFRLNYGLHVYIGMCI